MTNAAAVERRKNPNAVALGKLGGKVKSEKKAEAARRNARMPRTSKARNGSDTFPQAGTNSRNNP